MSETVFLRPRWSQLAADGTLSIPSSIHDDNGHWSAMMEVPPTAEDYAFWRWVVAEHRFCRVLDQQAVAVARAAFGNADRDVEGQSAELSRSSFLNAQRPSSRPPA